MPARHCRGGPSLSQAQAEFNTITARLQAAYPETNPIGSLLIAGIGQYAVVAFDMRRRTREIGVRIALGASARQILTGVIQEGLRLTVAGLALGFALSVAAGMGLRRLLYGVTPTDAWTYAGVFVLLACASLAACYLPARRAARVNPVQALREE